MGYFRKDWKTGRAEYPCPKYYEIAQDTYEILIEVVDRFDENSMFVFRDTIGNHYAVIHREMWIGPTKRFNGEWTPAYCIGRISSGHSMRFGIEVMFEIEIGPCVFRLDVRRDNEYCMNCGFLSVDENSGCYDMEDQELPEYSCPYLGSTNDQNDVFRHCCRYWVPDKYDAIKDRVELMRSWQKNNPDVKYTEEIRWLQSTMKEIEERRKQQQS